MNIPADPAIGASLARLEAGGRRHLSADARRQAWRKASVTAARVAVAASLAALILRLVLPVSGRAAVATAVALSLLSLVADAMRRLRGTAISRAEALGAIDRQLGLKDRAATSDEFLRLHHRDGFQEAALGEAAPLIERASPDALIPSPPDPVARRWPLLAVAAMLLAAASLVHIPGGTQPGLAVGRGAGARGPLVADATGDPRRAGPAGERGAVPPDSADAGRRAAAGGSAGASADASATSATDGRGEASGTSDAAAESAAATARSSASAGAGTAARAGPGQRGGGGAAADSDAAMPAMGGRENSGETGRSGTDAGRADDRRNAPVGRNAGEMPVSSIAGRQPGATPRSGQPSQGGQQPQGDNRQGGGQKGGSGNQGQQGQGSGTAQGQGAGRGAGQDAIKRTRGSSTMLLAVPMEDRLIGMAGRGRAQSVTREAPSRPTAAGPVAAQDRGAFAGDAGQVLHRADDAHDAGVLRRYFDRRAGGTGTR